MPHMIDTIMFDLDGTLLPFTQEAFVTTYFAELGKVFVRMDMDAAAAIKAVWAGTKAMSLNDGSRLNSDVFWDAFAAQLSLTDGKRREVEGACDSFYTNEFNVAKSVMIPTDIPKRLVGALSAKGYGIVLATNPLFPACAVDTRLQWLGLEPGDFLFYSHYANSTYCKPSLGYYQEVFDKIGKAPEQCFMAGNSPVEDMSVGELGTETYLVTDCLENESGVDISAFARGTLADLEAYLMTFPDIA